MEYVKMHGLGNDFILFYDEVGATRDYTKLAKTLCHRQTGIGADGLIIAAPSKVADMMMRIVNADGSEAEMCGNGVRVFAKFIYEQGLVDKTELAVETLAGIMKPSLHVTAGKVTSVTVNMGKPQFVSPLLPQGNTINGIEPYTLEIDGRELTMSTILLGVPHTQVFVEDVTKVDLQTVGALIEKHPHFPQGTNVNFVELVDKTRIKVRTWERGAGATLACGTGSCAAAVTAALLGHTGRTVEVALYLGSLYIQYEEDGTVFMTGSAEKSFTAII